MPTLAASPHALGGRQGLAYATLAVPLAFVSLPLYVNLPYHYASVLGVSLPALGAVMLAVRALDAVIDPALGRLADRLFSRGKAWHAAALGSAVLAAAFAALWRPPSGDPAVMLAWLVAAGMCTLMPLLLISGGMLMLLELLLAKWGARIGRMRLR